MYEWNEMVQMMVDWVEEHLDSKATLQEMSERLGYSPYYCTRQFHLLTGMTLRDYVRLRRITHAALEVRDTELRLLDIAVKYGYSSQEAFSRSFVKAFGMTPAVYRESRRPIPLSIRAEVFSPYHYAVKERVFMSEVKLQEVEVKIERIPAHQFIGVWDTETDNYGDFWANGHDCDEVSGLLESMSHHTLPGQLGQTAGWFYREGRKGYLYGIPVSADYAGDIPEGMECRLIPESEYLVFYYPPFDYMKDNAPVMSAVEGKAWSFDPGELDYVWDEAGEKQDYQRHFPEGYGYAVLRPVKRAE